MRESGELEWGVREWGVSEMRCERVGSESGEVGERRNM